MYCVICALYPINSCIWRPSYHFCSVIFTAQLVQYYKIVVIAYFGEVLKMCANVSYLMMTLNRYLLIGKDHAKWLVTLAKLEVKWVIGGSVLFSGLLNIGHAFQYLPTESFLFSAQNFLQATASQVAANPLSFALTDYSTYSDYPLANPSYAFSLYTIVYFLVNFVLFLAVNTGVEVALVVRMRKEMRAKRQRMANMHAAAAAADPATVTEAANRPKSKQETEDGKKERRVIIMVVLNSLFNFLLRSPDILVLLESSSFYFFFLGSAGVSSGTLLSQVAPGLLNFLLDLGYFTYILTFTSNFFIYYFFNSKFKECVVFFSKSKKK
jgi:hypothetical protein